MKLIINGIAYTVCINSSDNLVYLCTPSGMAVHCTGLTKHQHLAKGNTFYETK